MITRNVEFFSHVSGLTFSLHNRYKFLKSFVVKNQLEDKIIILVSVAPGSLKLTMSKVTTELYNFIF